MSETKTYGEIISKLEKKIVELKESTFELLPERMKSIIRYAESFDSEIISPSDWIDINIQVPEEETVLATNGKDFAQGVIRIGDKNNPYYIAGEIDNVTHYLPISKLLKTVPKTTI